MSLKSFFQITNSTKKNLLVTGASASLNDRIVAEYLKQPQLADFERVTLDLETEPVGELIATLSESSLFATQKIVVVKNPIFLTGKLSSIKKHELEELERIFEQVDSLEHLLILKADVEKLDSRRKLFKLIKQNFQMVVTNFKPYVLPQIVAELVAENNFTIDNNAKAELIQRSNQQIDLVLANLNKLYSATDNQIIDLDLVKKNIEQSIEQNIFELLTYSLNHRYSEMLALFDDQMRQGTAVVQLTAILSSQLSFMLTAKILGQKMGEGEVASALAAHPYRVKLALQNKYPLTQMAAKQKRLTEIEFGYKSGQYQGETILKSYLLDF